jgi:hypothetical protein
MTSAYFYTSKAGQEKTFSIQTGPQPSYLIKTSRFSLEFERKVMREEPKKETQFSQNGTRESYKTDAAFLEDNLSNLSTAEKLRYREFS